MMDLFSLTVVHTTVSGLAWPGLMVGTWDKERVSSC